MADATDVARTASDARRLGRVRIGVLGPLTVHDDAGPIHVAGVHRRRLLALLASRPGRAVSIDAIVDAISAEDVSKFPDTNIAESLSHLPGVSVDRNFGEGEKVSINGKDKALNRIMVEGNSIE